MFPAQTPSARTLSLLLVWMVLACDVHASTASAVSSVPHDKGSPHLEWFLADIDGDGIKERAVSAKDRNGYSIEVFLGASSDRVLLSYRSITPLLRFFTEDVDRDNDQDLVALDSSGPAQYVIWINQGNARFDQTPRKSCLLRSEMASGKVAVLRSFGRADPLVQSKRRVFDISHVEASIVAPGDGAPLIGGLSPTPGESVILQLTSRSPPDHTAG